MLAGDKSDGESGAEGYLHILTDCLAEGYLLLDYAKANPIADDIEMFGQAGIELDPTRVQYILDGIRSLAVDLNDRIGDAEAKNFQGWIAWLLIFFKRCTVQSSPLIWSTDVLYGQFLASLNHITFILISNPDIRSARFYGQFSSDKTLTLQAGSTVDKD